MSDHRQITFELTDVKQEIRLWRNPRKTDWVGYEGELTEKVKQLPFRLSTGCEIEHCADTCDVVYTSLIPYHARLNFPWRSGMRVKMLEWICVSAEL